jgi:predicted transcriptional regulator
MAYESLDNILTKNEKEVYIELLKLGESTASPILQKTGLQNSVFYRTIHRLLEKGFVKYVLKGKIKHFSVVKPEIFLSFIKEEEEKIKDTVLELNKMQKDIELSASAEVFLGYKGLKSMFYALTENSKPNQKYCYFSTDLKNFEKALEKVYIPFRLHRQKNKIYAYGIHNIELKGKIKEYKHNYNKFVQIPIPPNVAIFNDKIAIASWGEIPTGILIRSKDIAEQYEKLFWNIWHSVTTLS